MRKELSKQATGKMCYQCSQCPKANITQETTNGANIVGSNNNVTYNDSKVILYLLDIIREQSKTINEVINTLLKAKETLQAKEIDCLLSTLLNHKTKDYAKYIRNQIL